MVCPPSLPRRQRHLNRANGLGLTAQSTSLPTSLRSSRVPPPTTPTCRSWILSLRQREFPSTERARLRVEARERDCLNSVRSKGAPSRERAAVQDLFTAIMLKVEEFAEEFRAQVTRELRAQVEDVWSAIDHPRDASLRDRRL